MRPLMLIWIVISAVTISEAQIDENSFANVWSQLQRYIKNNEIDSAEALLDKAKHFKDSEQQALLLNARGVV